MTSIIIWRYTLRGNRAAAKSAVFDPPLPEIPSSRYNRSRVGQIVNSQSEVITDQRVRWRFGEHNQETRLHTKLKLKSGLPKLAIALVPLSFHKPRHVFCCTPPNATCRAERQVPAQGIVLHFPAPSLFMPRMPSPCLGRRHNLQTRPNNSSSCRNCCRPP